MNKKIKESIFFLVLIISPIVSFAACTPAETILNSLLNLKDQQKFTTIRHRGDFTHDAPENSLMAFRNSYQKCRPGVETDIRTTKDKVLVLFHDVNIGKMLETNFNPETNIGPNSLLSENTLSDLKAKNLVNIARQPTNEKIVTLEEMINDYIQQNAQSLVYLEFKNANDIVATAQLIDKIQKSHPNIDLFKRFIFKFSMGPFPTWQDWLNEYAKSGIQKRPNVQVAISANIANTMNNLDANVSSYAREPEVLSIEVTMKDSSGYINRQKVIKPFGNISVEYFTTSSLSKNNARSNTMARVMEIARENKKPIGQFVPIPDWVMWRKSNTFSWDKQLNNLNLNNVTFPTTITAKEGFFNNNSMCCYALADRLSANERDPEQFDQRLLLPWLEDLGVTMLTADDTDNINAYFKSKGKMLELGETTQPNPEMNSVINLQQMRIPTSYVTNTNHALEQAADLLKENGQAIFPYKVLHRSDMSIYAPFLDQCLTFDEGANPELRSSLNEEHNSQPRLNNGAHAVFRKCNGRDLQRWIFDIQHSSYRLIGTDKCLDHRNSSNNRPTLWDCNNLPTQHSKPIVGIDAERPQQVITVGNKTFIKKKDFGSQDVKMTNNLNDAERFEYSTAGHLQATSVLAPDARPLYCLDEIKSNSSTSGWQIVYAECKLEDNSQSWIHWDTKQLSKLNSSSRKCMDSQNGTGNTLLITWDCNASTSWQQFYFPYDYVDWSSRPAEIKNTNDFALKTSAPFNSNTGSVDIYVGESVVRNSNLNPDSQLWVRGRDKQQIYLAGTMLSINNSSPTRVSINFSDPTQWWYGVINRDIYDHNGYCISLNPNLAVVTTGCQTAIFDQKWFSPILNNF